jgi:cyclopropane fatty-acyl-phospholipid synthase-like methyltransferase
LAKEQAAFGTQRIKENGVSDDQARILCMDFRNVPHPQGYFNKISCLEMAEHVGIRRYGTFLKEVYNLLADDGVMVFQVAGIRTNWQFEDLNWGLL